MLNDRLGAAQDVAARLHALEAAIDAALVCASELIIALPTARQRAKLSAMVGHEATLLTGEAMSALHQARASTIDAHRELSKTQVEIGLKAYAMGDLWKFKNPMARNLELVTAHAA
jgi:hypothetical protein